MAYVLNNGHALASNVISLIGVEGGSLVDVKRPGITFTPSAGFTYGSGTYGEHILAPATNGSSVTMSTPVPQAVAGMDAEYTVFVVVNNVAGIYAGGTNIASPFESLDGFGPVPCFDNRNANKISLAQNSSNTASLVVGSYNAIGSAYSMCMTHSGSQVNDLTELYVNGVFDISRGGAINSTPGRPSVSKLGSAQGYTWATAQYVWWVVFDKVLTSSEVLSLHNSLGANNAFALVSTGGSDTTVNATLATVSVSTYTATVVASSSSTIVNATLGAIGVSAFDATIVTEASITTDVLKNNTGTVLASTSGIIASVYDLSTGALVVRKTGLTSDGSGVVTFSDVSLSNGTEYLVTITIATADGVARITAG